jgi:hypothetical protein
MATHLSDLLHAPDSEWTPFPGGELEGQRPRRLCPSCRSKLQREVAQPFRAASSDAGLKRRVGADAPRRPLCFACYRLELDREKALKAAGELNTASEARFQDTLPLEPVNVPRVRALEVERAAERTAMRAGAGRFVDRRRQAQIAARHALQAVAAGLQTHQTPGTTRDRAFADAAHAAELQLPESWLPFVVSRSLAR